MPSRHIPNIPLPGHLEPVEFLDSADKPIGVLSLKEAHRQRLLHRSVLVLVYNAENKVYLQRRAHTKSLYPGCWDISATGHVQAGESREDAAHRELHEELGLSGATLTLRYELPASLDTNNEFVTLYTASRLREEPCPNPAELAGGGFFDKDEVDCLVSQFREQLTPAVVYFHEKGLLFQPR